jgi:hypothetical protein
MPVHDWTRVRPGTFHDFHTSWITHLKEVLNDGVLPSGFYAMVEQRAADVIPDVLTLETSDAPSDPVGAPIDHRDGMIAVAERPPQVSFVASADAEAVFFAAKRRTLVIRHATGDRIVALIEIVSPGNKQKHSAFSAFLDKAIASLGHGYHLLIVDLFPPGPFDPEGIHGAIWAELERPGYEAPEDRPLTLAAYTAGFVPQAYVEPTSVGAILKDMPLFLKPGWYVNVPLEQTYQAAWRGMPQRWRQVIEG